MNPLDFADRFGVPDMSSREALYRAVEFYREDPAFCVPTRAREALSASRGRPEFVMMGTKDFAQAFVACAKDRATVRYVVDDFKGHRGEQFAGLDVISSDRLVALARENPNLIALNCCRFDYSKRFFDDWCRLHGIAHLNYEQAIRLLKLPALDHRIADWGPDIVERLDEYVHLADMLVDDFSRETLYSVLTFHLTCNPEWSLNVTRPYSTLYFRSGLFAFGQHEKMVDCGASIGESTTALIGTTQGRFDRSWMIEPDRFNGQTLRKLIRRYAGSPIAEKLSLLEFAVGDEPMEVPFVHQGGHGGMVVSADAGVEGRARVETVDRLVDDRPTFIKMDIEGFELAALRGSQGTIKASRPKLAISAYHRSTDLIDIPKYVMGLGHDYRIGLRHHTEDRYDTCLYFY